MINEDEFNKMTSEWSEWLMEHQETHVTLYAIASTFITQMPKERLIKKPTDTDITKALAALSSAMSILKMEGLIDYQLLEPKK